MKKNELLLWFCYMLFLGGVLIMLTLIAGCDSGWSVAGWEI